MLISKTTLETLLDLVEIKLSCIEVYDREDSRELAKLEQCRRELIALYGSDAPSAPAEIVAFGGKKRAAG
jgi:hypothetical protein